MAAAVEAVDLAHAPDLMLGRLTVRPSVRQIIRDDGANEVLEPRVMQVLLALARADGAIVTRDELTRWCWDNRIVGEDAINRVISRLRRSAEGIGAGSFRIETITKVGYRLLDVSGRSATGQRESPTALRSARSRRGILAGAGATVAAGLLGGGWLLTARRQKRADAARPNVLFDQAMVALGQDTREGQNQAVGLLRRLVAEQPGFADGWGALAVVYASIAHYRPSQQASALRARAIAAADRADALDHGNAYAAVARGTALPRMGNWLANERALRIGLRAHPNDAELLYGLSQSLTQVGRNREAVSLVERVRAIRPPTPDIYYRTILALWGAGRLDEADQMMDQAVALYPSHYAIWFARCYILMYSGRAQEGLALLDNVDGRPSGIPMEEFDNIAIVARALISRSANDRARAMRIWRARARSGAGHAENAMQFAVALGQLDQAYAIADAYYFGRGFAVPDLRFTSEQGTYTPAQERQTWFLFTPVMANFRADSRFRNLTAETGLDAYWRAAAVAPDYRRI